MPAIWVSNEFATKAKAYGAQLGQNVPKVYIMSAAHRGDMYHVRAAVFTNPLPVIVYGSPPQPNDLVDYVTVIPEDWKIPFFITQLPINQLQGNKTPASDMQKIDLQLIREPQSTREFKTNIAKHDFKRSMANTGQYRQLIREKFKTLNAFSAIGLPDTKTKHVLVLHRDTGTSGPNGVYPELDTGAALSQLVSMINSQRDSTGKVALKAIVAGNAQAGPNSIGQYWTRLAPIVQTFKPKKITKRDIEAEFLLWAFEEGYFSMVVGFRSGMLDLFTFMGIPTLSIGLRNMAGEPRHALLVEQSLKRINVQYDVPRHNATGWVMSRANQVDSLLNSPAWDEPAPFGMTRASKTQQQKDAARGTQPGDLSFGDAWTVEVALRTAAGRFLTNWGLTVASVKYDADVRKQMPITDNIITVQHSRVAYPLENIKDLKAREVHFTGLRQADKSVMTLMADARYKTDTLLPDLKKNEYKIEYDGLWTAAVPLITKSIGKQFKL